MSEDAARCAQCNKYLNTVYVTCETCEAKLCNERCLGEHLEERLAQAQGRNVV